jgi:branched-chain amino acid transport system permease protein
MTFFLALVVDGTLAGSLYALVALAFVVVYKAARMINFALGEWMMLASRFVAVGVHGFGLGLAGSLGLGCAGMVALAVLFNRIVLRRLVGRPLISLIMVTIGLGAFIRGAAALAFAGIPSRLPLPVPEDGFTISGVPVAADKLVAAAIAAVCIAMVAWFFHATRTGVALQAIADDQQTAMAVGIDLDRYFTITWALVGVISVLAGTLWAFVTGGSFSLVLLGLRVFPIVIIGGLDSIPGTIIGAIVVGVLESLAAGYLDPILGGGFSNVASYVLLVIALLIRPNGLFGRPNIEHV